MIRQLRDSVISSFCDRQATVPRALVTMLIGVMACTEPRSVPEPNDPIASAPEAFAPGFAGSSRLLSREAETGRLLFRQYCAFCHGHAGDGFGINAPNLPLTMEDLTAPAFLNNRTDRDLAEAIRRGSRDPGLPPVMPAWERRFSASEIDALVAYIRTLPMLAPAATNTNRK